MMRLSTSRLTSICNSPLPIAITLATIGLLVTFPVQDFDIFWHLANGRAMLKQGAIVNQEIFSFTSNGKPFSNHAWLAQIIFFVVFKTWGANGLIAVKVLITVSIGLCLYLFARRQDVSPLPATLICLLAIGASLFRYVERPELFSSLFLALTAALLFSYRSSRHAGKVLVALPLIMILWDFMHGALYGAIFLIAFMVGETVKAAQSSLARKGLARCRPAVTATQHDKTDDHYRPATSVPQTSPGTDAPQADAASNMTSGRMKTLWLWVGITFALMLISPYGLRSYEVFFEFMNNNLMTSMTAEFQPTTWREQPLFWGLLAITTGSILAAGRRLDLTSLCVLIPFAGLAIRYVRGIGPFSLVAAILLAVNLAPILRRYASTRKQEWWQNALFLLILIGGLGFGLYDKFSSPPRYNSLGLGINADGFPVGSARFVKAANLPGNMYNTDRYGGYLAYYLFPERRIFHYNHHLLFNALERYVHEPESRAQWGINYAIIGRSDEWDMFSKDGFVPIYWEPSGAVMIKKNSDNQAIIERYAIRYFSPLMPKEEFYKQAKNPDVLPVLARETSDYLAQRQDLEKTNILVTMLLRQAAIPPATCLELLTRAERHNATSPRLSAAIGNFYYQQGQHEPATRYLQQALSLTPTLIEAHFTLAYLLYDQKKYQEAADRFNKILVLRPRHPDTLYGLGLCYYQLGRRTEAKRSFQDYLDLVPDGPWAEKARNFLDGLSVGS